MNTKLSAIVGQYRMILLDDGMVAKEELIEMLKVDEEILEKYKTEEMLNKLADEILKIPKKYAGGSLANAKEQRLKLYNQNLSDTEIAQIQGVTVCAIASWRIKNLLPNNSNTRNLSDAENNRRMELYEQGLFDRDIAKKLDIKPQAIAEWRKRRGLPSNFKLNKEEKKCSNAKYVTN